MPEPDQQAQIEAGQQWRHHGNGIYTVQRVGEWVAGRRRIEIGQAGESIPVWEDYFRENFTPVVARVAEQVEHPDFGTPTDWEPRSRSQRSQDQDREQVERPDEACAVCSDENFLRGPEPEDDSTYIVTPCPACNADGEKPRHSLAHELQEAAGRLPERPDGENETERLRWTVNKLRGERDQLLDGRRVLSEAAKWVIDNWDRQASQHASMPALRAALGRLPERPDEGPKRYLVWLCDGCDECDPPAGLPRSQFPCDGPSKSGKCVVLAKDYDRAVASRQPADSDRVLAEIASFYFSPRTVKLSEVLDLAWAATGHEPVTEETRRLVDAPRQPAEEGTEAAVKVLREWIDTYDHEDDCAVWGEDLGRAPVPADCTCGLYGLEGRSEAAIDALLAARPPVSENEKGPRPA